MKEMYVNPKQKRELELDLVPLLKVLLSRLWIMLLVGVVLAGIAFGGAKLLIRPTYRCGFSAYVNNQHAQSEKNALTNQDLIAAQQLTKTFSYIIRSNTILSASLKSIDSDLTYEAFSKMVSTEIRDETELISVYVVHTDPQTAYELANAIAKTAPSYMAEIVEGSSMKIVDYPVYSEVRYQPNYVRYGLLGFILGVLIVAVIVIIRFFKDDTIRDDSDIEQSFSIPVLGVIPDINNAGQSGGSYYYKNYGYGYAKPKTEGEDKA